MEATLDIWEIPPESASRVGHPAPFPVALPERLIHMNTYEGELVLDPFMGSGTTAVAAVRTGRHFVGYDTDPGYAAAATRRALAERVADQVHLGASAGRKGDPLVEGWAAKDLAIHRLEAAGFTDIADGDRVVAGVEPTLVATHPSGRVVRIEVVGGRTSSRPGAQRLEYVWRAIAKAAVSHEADPRTPFVVLTIGQPQASTGGKAIDAVTGKGRPVTAVLDLLDDAVVEQLRSLA